MEKINNFNSDLFLSESEYDGNDGDYNDNEVTKYHDKQSNCKPKTKKKYRTSASESTVKKKKRSKKVSDVMSNVNKEKEASTSNANYDSDYPQSFNEMNNDPDFEMKHTSHDSFYDFNKDAQIDRIRETSPFSIEASASNISKGTKQHRLSSDDDTDNDDQKRRSNSYDDHEDNEDDRRGGFLHLGNLKYNIDKNTEKNRQILYEDFNKEQFESSYEMAESFSDDAPTFNISNSSKIKYNESFENDKLLKRSKNSDENSAKKLCLGKVGNTSITTGSATNGKGKAERMMEKMGYQAGKGLGKNNQGRLEPVQTSTQHGRRGIGLSYPELEAARLKWNPDEEIVQIKEEMEWLKNTHRHIPTIKEMHDWMVLGPKKETIDDETKFCEAKIVEDILNSKTIFDKINKTEKRKARTRSNPYETIRNAFFLNRAAVKMANMDKACDFLFTKPNNLKNNELLYFADVCAGPGGFSEYVLWRKKWHAKGFGFTLKNENDFKLGDFYAGSPETFHTFYGPKGNGDVCDVSNQEAFRDLIMKHTHGKGVHFMMSDGGFSVENQENIQEIMSKQIYLCQCLVALMIVRNGGNFVTKLFDLFTPFSVGLIYLIYRCFDEVCIFKPNTSRPANSERYLICKGKRHDTNDIVKYLFYANKILLKRDVNKDVIELVPLKELEIEKEFVQYLRKSNNNLGRKQIVGLLKIAAFCEDSTLIEPRQADMRRECLKYWELPDESRTVPTSSKPQENIKHLMKNRDNILSHQQQKLTYENIRQTVLHTPYDWLCTPCGTGESNKLTTFYMGMGRRKVYRYMNNSWEQINDLKIELPPDTLVYAEIINEIAKERKSQRKIYALHILDAWILGGEDISQKYLPDRHELIKKFCEALWKPFPNDFARVRAKELYAFSPDIDKKLQLIQRYMKNNRPELTCDIPKTPLDDEETLYFVPNSIIFLRSTSRPWFRYYSKSQHETYIHNQKTNESHFDRRRPPAAEAKFDETFSNSMIWYWPHDEMLSMNTVIHSIREKCPELIDSK